MLDKEHPGLYNEVAFSEDDEMGYKIMERRKELKEQYKQMRPPMGIYIVRCEKQKKCFIETHKNIKSRINSIRLKLLTGTHPNKELQKEWTQEGEEKFVIEVLESLNYDSDESKTDYTEDLDLLELIWEEKLTKEGFEFYKARL